MATAADATGLSEKIIKFESFLNEKLRADLSNVLKLDKETANDIENCMQLSIILTQFKEKQFNSSYPNEPIKTLSDIGGNFYVETVIDDPNRALIYLGLGFYLQMTLDEAIKFLETRKSTLHKRRESYAISVSKINANIKLVLEGLRELQSISPTD